MVAYPDDHVALFEEMRSAGVKFIANLYGRTTHGFSAPYIPAALPSVPPAEADAYLYFPLADERSWEQLYFQLKETFDPTVVNGTGEVPLWGLAEGARPVSSRVGALVLECGC